MYEPTAQKMHMASCNRMMKLIWKFRKLSYAPVQTHTGTGKKILGFRICSHHIDADVYPGKLAWDTDNFVTNRDAADDDPPTLLGVLAAFI